MKAGVIDDNDLPWLQLGHQELLRPGLDQSAIAVALKGHRCHNRAVAPTRYHADATGTMPQLEGMKSFALSAPSVGVILGVIPASFVHVDDISTTISLQLR